MAILIAAMMAFSSVGQAMAAETAAESVTEPPAEVAADVTTESPTEAPTETPADATNRGSHGSAYRTGDRGSHRALRPRLIRKHQQNRRPWDLIFMPDTGIVPVWMKEME